MTASLFSLTGDALLLQARINDTAERLFSEDPAEVASATQALEELITNEADNRKALEAKADAWCWAIDNLRAKAAAQREHAERLKALADEGARRAEALQNQLTDALERISPETTSWALPEHKLTSRRSVAVDLDPDLMPADLPEGLYRVKTTYSADKTAIKAALQAGTVVEGASLVERRSWTIR